MSELKDLRYNNTAITLHWVLAILIIGLLILGYFLPDLPKTPLRKELFNIHKSFGLIVFGIVLFRIYWRLTTVVPDSVPSHPFLVKLAHLVHIFVYILIAAVPASALIASSFNHGYNLFIFHWEPIFKINEDLAHQWMKVHAVLAYSLSGLLALHIIATLWHQLVKKDALIKRMWYRA